MNSPAMRGGSPEARVVRRGVGVGDKSTHAYPPSDEKVFTHPPANFSPWAAPTRSSSRSGSMTVE